MSDQPLEIQDVSAYILARVNELQALETQYKGTEHEYPLKVGQFELLRLAVTLQIPSPV